MFSSVAHYIFFAPLTLFLAASTLNTKAPGLAWIWFILAGLLAALLSRQIAPPGPSGEASSSKVQLYTIIARIWLFTCAVALLLKTVPMLYWADPWRERHAEFRLFLSALGLYWLCQFQQKQRSRTYLDPSYLAWVGSGLAVACALALCVVLTKGSNGAPTNRIQWACALAISSCTLLALARVAMNCRLRYFWLTASLAGLLAVLASDVRGAYGLVLVWPVLAFDLFKDKMIVTVTNAWQKIGLLAAALLLVPILILSPFVQKPLNRIQLAFSEAKSYEMLITQGATKSTVERLYIWERSLQAIVSSPWIGYGHDGRISHIQRWGEDVNSREIMGFRHVHNEYLQSLMDHGLWGLGSWLSYSLGMLFMARKLRASKHVEHKGLASGLVGVVAMLMSSGLSNMNFTHNYYPTVLSLAVTLLVCAAMYQIRSTTHEQEPVR